MEFFEIGTMFTAELSCHHSMLNIRTLHVSEASVGIRLCIFMAKDLKLE